LSPNPNFDGAGGALGDVTNNNNKGEETSAGKTEENKKGVPVESTRRYLSCPAAVSVALLKKLVQMKYQLSPQEHLVS
jgi:hypothetical protein